MQGQIAKGYTVGNGAAINVSLGWIPDFVQVINLTDADKVTNAIIGQYSVPFSSGGTATIAVGDTIIGATSGSQARVLQVLLYSGTWAGGDAAGFFVIGEQTGTFASENVYIASSGTTNDATITAAVTFTVSYDTEVAAETTNAAIIPYAGAIGSAAKGFTIGSTVAEEAKLLFWWAWRADETVNVTA